MKATIRSTLIFSFLLIIKLTDTLCQDTLWTLQACIDYALKENIQIKKTDLTNNANIVYENQAKAQRFPSLYANVGQNYAWSKPTTSSNAFSGSNNTNFAVNSNISIFNSFKINNKIKQSEVNFESGKYNSEATKESISLSVLNAYLQVLYADELVNTNQKQLKSTDEQLKLAAERMSIGIIAKSDYLQVKSQYATENLNLANAKSQLVIDRLNLMQIMQFSVTDSFTVYKPKLDSLILQQREPNADSIYNLALVIKPQVKSAALNKESALLNEKIAQADYWPRLSLNAGIGTLYSSDYGTNFGDQFNQNLKPTAGLTLSIPIYQNRQIKSQVEIAGITTENAELDEMNTKYVLRQNIEQATADVTTAQIKYEANVEQYNAALESYVLSSEKFSNGLINSVDFLIQKTNLNVAESQLLQAKYNLIFSYKILDFYSGIPLTL